MCHLPHWYLRPATRSGLHRHRRTRLGCRARLAGLVTRLATLLCYACGGYRRGLGDGVGLVDALHRHAAPSTPVAVLYDCPTVLFSLLAAVAASWVRCFVVSRETHDVCPAFVGSLFSLRRIAAMHYIGMEAFGCRRCAKYSTRRAAVHFPGRLVAFSALADVI